MFWFLFLHPPLYSTGDLTVTHSSPYTTPRRETLNPFKDLYLAYLGEILYAAVIRFCLDYRALPKKM